MAISIHALLAESDISASCSASVCRNFYPRSPCGERRMATASSVVRRIFLSTLSLRRATLHAVKVETVSDRISIHALLAESDVDSHAHHLVRGAFLSTLSLRRATVFYYSDEHICPVISIHALLAESDNAFACSSSSFLYFYPRSPCGERLAYTVAAQSVIAFLSTLSLRRATCTQ